MTLTLIFAYLAQLMDQDSGEQSCDIRAKLYECCFLSSKARQSFDEIGYIIPSSWVTRIDGPSEDAQDFKRLIRKVAIATNSKLVAAWKEIGKFFATKTRESASWRCTFAKYLLEQIAVVQLTVPDSYDLQAIFETLNARGKPLDEVDLLRNFFLQRVSKCETNFILQVRKGFEAMDGELVRKKHITEYIRCDLQMRFGYIPEKNLFRNIRDQITDKYGKSESCKVIAELVGELGSDNMIMFKMLKNPESYALELDKLAGWPIAGKQRKLLDCLIDLSGYSISFSVLHALFLRHLNDNKVTRKNFLLSCKLLSTFFMRVSFIHTSIRPSLYEKEMAALAKLIYDQQDDEVKAIRNTLQQVDGKGNTTKVMDRAFFINEISNSSLKSVRKLKKFFIALEKDSHKDTYINSNDCAIVQIMPDGLPDYTGWNGFGDEQSTYINRLGNLFLLEKDAAEKFNLNNQQPTSVEQRLAAVRGVAVNSAYKLTNQLGGLKKWNEHQLSLRQKKLAKLAADLWNTGQ